MPSVLDRSALEQSPLADLHLLANELGVDGFRRLRKPDLVDAILTRQSGEEVVAPEPEPEVEAPVEAVAERSAPAEDDDGPKRSRRGRRGGRGRRREEEEGDAALVDRDEPVAAPARVAGATTSAPSRAPSSCWPTAPASCASPPDPTDDDVYISAAQVKRCELVSGDRVSRPDPRRPPLGALPVADPRRDDQRPPGRGGRRGHALRGPAGRLAVRAHRARLRRPDGQGDRVADAVRQGLARRHRRPVALGQERGAAAARGRARRARGARGQRRADRRAAGGDRRLPGHAGRRR